MNDCFDVLKSNNRKIWLLSLCLFSIQILIIYMIRWLSSGRPFVSGFGVYIEDFSTYIFISLIIRTVMLIIGNNFKFSIRIWTIVLSSIEIGLAVIMVTIAFIFGNYHKYINLFWGVVVYVVFFIIYIIIIQRYKTSIDKTLAP